MCDAPGYIAPCGVTLSGDEAGYIVEGQHKTALALAGAHAQTSGIASTRHIDFLLGLTSATCCRQRRKLGNGIRQFSPPPVISRQGEQDGGLPICDRDPSVGVQPDHAGADLGQNRFDELPAFLRLLAGAPQRLLLSLKIVGHVVEGTRQYGNLAEVSVCVHARAQVSSGDTPGGLY